MSKGNSIIERMPEMKRYELVVIWDTGEKAVYEHMTEEEAQRSQKYLQFVFGNQISWMGIRKRS